MKLYTDRYGITYEIIPEEDEASLLFRAEACMKKILEVLEKHQCKIRAVNSPEERCLAPHNQDGLVYTKPEYVERFSGWQKSSVPFINIDFDQKTLKNK